MSWPRRRARQWAPLVESCAQSNADGYNRKWRGLNKTRERERMFGRIFVMHTLQGMERHLGQANCYSFWAGRRLSPVGNAFKVLPGSRTFPLCGALSGESATNYFQTAKYCSMDLSREHLLTFVGSAWAGMDLGQLNWIGTRSALGLSKLIL